MIHSVFELFLKLKEFIDCRGLQMNWINKLSFLFLLGVVQVGYGMEEASEELTGSISRDDASIGEEDKPVSVQDGGLGGGAGDTDMTDTTNPSDVSPTTEDSTLEAMSGDAGQEVKPTNNAADDLGNQINDISFNLDPITPEASPKTPDAQPEISGNGEPKETGEKPETSGADAVDDAAGAGEKAGAKTGEDIRPKEVDENFDESKYAKKEIKETKSDQQADVVKHMESLSKAEDALAGAAQAVKDARSSLSAARDARTEAMNDRDVLRSQKNDLESKLKSAKPEEKEDLEEQLKATNERLIQADTRVENAFERVRVAENGVKTAEDEARGLLDKRDAAAENLTKSQTEAEAKRSKTFGENWGQVRNSVRRAKDSILNYEDKIAQIAEEEGSAAAAKTVAKDLGNATWKGTKYVGKKMYDFGHFLAEQMKVGFAFMLPGDMMQVLQAGLQAKEEAQMIKAAQSFAGITMWTVDGMIPASDAENGVFLYSDVSRDDDSKYLDGNARFFMSYNPYDGTIGGSWLGSGSVNYMIEFATGFIFDSEGGPLVYQFPAVPMVRQEGYLYSQQVGSSTVSTSVHQLIAATVIKGLEGHSMHKVEVGGLIEGFKTKDESPAGNAQVASFFKDSISLGKGKIPLLFNSTLHTFTTGIASPVFNVNVRAIQGLEMVAYILTNYDSLYNSAAKADSDTTNIKPTSQKLFQMIAALKQSQSISDFTTVMSEQFAISADKQKGILSNENLLMSNVFVYESDDTPTAQCLRNNVLDELKPYVHDYLVGVDETGGVVPVLVPSVNISGAQVDAALPSVVWVFNPDVVNLVSLVSGISYAPGLVPVLINGDFDYSQAKNIHNLVTSDPAQGSAIGYAHIAGFKYQMEAMRLLARHIIEKGPFKLRGHYIAERVQGLEELYDLDGKSLDNLSGAESVDSLGLAAQEKVATSPTDDTYTIQAKKSDVQNNIFIYKINNALANNTLPDYVIPVMVNANRSFQIIPLGGQSIDGTSAISNDVQALISLVTSQVYDPQYNLLPADYTTNILVSIAPGQPLTCDPTKVLSSKYKCINGCYVEPNGENKPLATAFLETEFNPNNIPVKNFDMPPFHFMFLSYDVLDIASKQSQDSGSGSGISDSLYGFASQVYSSKTLGGSANTPLYEVLPERFTGIHWPTTIEKGLEAYKALLNIPAAQTPTQEEVLQQLLLQTKKEAAIADKGKTKQQLATQATQEEQDKQARTQVIKTVVDTLSKDVFNSTDYTIFQVHDEWRTEYLDLLGTKDPGLLQAQMGPLPIGDGWSLVAYSQDDILRGNYIYNLLDKNKNPLPGIWVTAQLNSIQSVEGSHLQIDISNKAVYNGASAVLPIINSDDDKVNGPRPLQFQLCLINNPSYLQRNMLANYNNLINVSVERNSGTVSGPMGIVPYENFGEIEKTVSGNVGQAFSLSSQTYTSNVLIDILTGRVLIATINRSDETITDSAGSSNTRQKITYQLLPLVNRRGYEITINVEDGILSNLHLSDFVLKYIQQNGTYPTQPIVKTSFAGLLDMTISRTLIDQGNYIYTSSSFNSLKPIDYIVGISGHRWNIPLEDQVGKIMSLVDTQILLLSLNNDNSDSDSNQLSIIDQQRNPQYEKADITLRKRILKGQFSGFRLFYPPDLDDTLLEGIHEAMNAEYESMKTTVDLPPKTDVNTMYKNSLYNYEDGNVPLITLDPSTFVQNNSGTVKNLVANSGQVESGNSYLYNDGSSHYYIGIGKMISDVDISTTAPLFDTYYAFDIPSGLKGFPFKDDKGNPIPGPIGGYFTRNKDGVYALSQTVFGEFAQQMATAYGIYVSPDHTQSLSIPLPIKPLCMDEATDAQLAGGKQGGTYMRYIKSLPNDPMLQTPGYTYYLYENVSTQNVGTAKSFVNLKPSPSAYLVQVNPPITAGLAPYYVDYVTGLRYDMKGIPLTENVYLYNQSSGTSDAPFIPFFTMGQYETLHVVMPFTTPAILKSFGVTGAGVGNQDIALVEYAANIMDIEFWFEDANKAQFYYTRKNPQSTSDDISALTGYIYKVSASDGTVQKTFNTSQPAIAQGIVQGSTVPTAAACIIASNQNMVNALIDASENKCIPIKNVYKMHLFNMDLNILNDANTSTPSNVTNMLMVPQTITASYDVKALAWTVTYNDPSNGNAPVTSTYVSFEDTEYQVTSLSAVGYGDATQFFDTSSNAFKISSLSNIPIQIAPFLQLCRHAFICKKWNSVTQLYDKNDYVVVGGILFKSSGDASSTFVNAASASKIEFKEVSAQQFIPQNSDGTPEVSITGATRASCYTVQQDASSNSKVNALNPIFTNYVFVYTPEYMMRPQSDLFTYYQAWQLEPEQSSEGTLGLIQYLDVENLVPVTQNNLYIQIVPPGARKLKGDLVPVILPYATYRNNKEGAAESAYLGMINSMKNTSANYKMTKAPVVPVISEGSIEDSAVIKASANSGQTSSISTQATGQLFGLKFPATAQPVYKQAIQKTNINNQHSNQLTVLTRDAKFMADNAVKMIDQKFANTTEQVIPASADGARLFFDPSNGYVVYKIMEQYDKDKRFYAVYDITQGYILMPMLFTDTSIGKADLPFLPKAYRFSGVVFDYDGLTIHETVPMIDLIAIEKELGYLGILEYGKQSESEIIFNNALQIPTLPPPPATPVAPVNAADNSKIVDNSDENSALVPTVIPPAATARNVTLNPNGPTTSGALSISSLGAPTIRASS